MDTNIVQTVWDGYGMPPKMGGTIEDFKIELQNWIDQVSDGTEIDELPEILYWELSDWFSDNVVDDPSIYEDQEDFFNVRMKVTLNTDGSYLIETPVNKPEWEIA